MPRVRAGNSVFALTTRVDVERTAELETSARVVRWDVGRPFTPRAVAAGPRASIRAGEKPKRLRGEFVFVKQPAEPVAAAQSMKRNRLAGQRRFADRRRLRERRPLGERAVRPVFVVVLRVCAHHALEVAAAEDQQPIKALAPQTADPALGVRPRLGRPHRRLDYTDALGAKDLVEGVREFSCRGRGSGSAPAPVG